MKTFRAIMGSAILMAAFLSVAPVSAQTKAELRAEKKTERKDARTRRQQKKELYKNPERAVKKEVRKLTKEGWKSMNLPMDKMLETTWEREFQYESDGFPKYIYATVQASGQSFSAAQMQAENVAKVRIAGRIGSSVAALADVALANSELDPSLAASIGKAIENSKILVSGKLGRIAVPFEIYRQNKSTYDVRLTVIYDMKNATKAFVDTMKDELKNESEENRAKLEALMGMDKLINTMERQNDED